MSFLPPAPTNLIDTPQISLPFTLTSDGFEMVEQGEEADIQQNVYIILAYRVGERVDMPEFGVPDQVFRKNGVDVDALQAAIVKWEPRAREVFQRDPNWINTLVEYIQVRSDPNG